MTGFIAIALNPVLICRYYAPGRHSKEPFLAPDMVYFDGNGGQRIYIFQVRDLVIVRIFAPKIVWDDSALPNIIVAGLTATKNR